MTIADMKSKVENFEPVLVFRPIRFAFMKNWYSIYRWKNKIIYPFGNEYVRLIDIGFVTVGYRYKRKRK